MPTYEEILAWAQETDKRIAAGKLPPLGSRRTSSVEAGTVAAGGNLLSDQEEAQVCSRNSFLKPRANAVRARVCLCVFFFVVLSVFVCVQMCADVFVSVFISSFVCVCACVRC